MLESPTGSTGELDSLGSKEAEENLPVQGDDRLAPSEPGELPSTSTRERIFESMSMMAGNVMNPVLNQVTSQHITEAIGLARDESTRGYDDLKHSRVWGYIFAGFVLSVLVGSVAFLVIVEESELVDTVVKLGAGLAAGGFGGYGFGISKRR